MANAAAVPLRRFEGNPILTPDQWPYPVDAVYNPGAAMVGDEVVLLVRVEDRSGLSHLTGARSADGVTGWRIDPNPTFPADQGRPEEVWGVEDPRITRCGEEFMVVYTGFSASGPLVCLATTTDFVSFERRGGLMPPENKDAALFPVRFADRWCLVNRPMPATDRAKAHIWVSWSHDLVHWGGHQVLLAAREGSLWDAVKVGLGPPPLETAYGWLVMFHGVKRTAAGSIYRLGLAMLDRDDPTVVLVRSDPWILGPDAPYERTGNVPQVVFPCGWLVGADGDTLMLYYGAADTCVALATGSLEAVIDHLYRHCLCGEPHRPGDRCPVARQHAARVLARTDSLPPG